MQARRRRQPTQISSGVLGIFDSGLGGVTVLRRVRERLPLQAILYFADQRHVPYGDRSESDLDDLLHRNVRLLCEQGVGAIVMACNTSCAIAERFGWPSAPVPILDLIESAAIAVERSGARRIGVIATTATARSGAYARQIVRRVPDAQVVEVAAPALVPLVEAGRLQGDEPLRAVRAVCALLPSGLEAVVLACTHYPLLDAHFARVLGPRVTRIDPALVHAERAASLVAANEGDGSLECITSGDPESFARAMDALVGDLHPRCRAGAVLPTHH